MYVFHSTPLDDYKICMCEKLLSLNQKTLNTMYNVDVSYIYHWKNYVMDKKCYVTSVYQGFHLMLFFLIQTEKIIRKESVFS